MLLAIIRPALLLTLVSFFTKQTRLLHPVYWPYFFICGLIGIAIPNTNMYFIASHIPAGLLAVLVNTVPLLVYPLALMAVRKTGWVAIFCLVTWYVRHTCNYRNKLRRTLLKLDYISYA